MNIADEKIIKLYSEQSVSDYIPEKVEIITNLNERLSATCYNLPTALLAGTNTLYAKSLYDLAKKVRFPFRIFRINKQIHYLKTGKFTVLHKVNTNPESLMVFYCKLI